MAAGAMEIEAKYEAADFAPLRARLGAAGAAYVGRVREVNRFFDRPDASLRRSGCGLRIRTLDVLDGPARPATLTYKGPLQSGPLKMRPETEFGIDDAVAARGFLLQIGFAEVFAFAKVRETWRAGRCLIELDELPLIGRFIEVEGPDETTVQALAETLGLAGAAPIRSSYLALLSRALAERAATPESLLTI